MSQPDRQPRMLGSPALGSIRHPTPHAEVPIALASPACLTTRRPRCLPRRCDGPASETLHSFTVAEVSRVRGRLFCICVGSPQF
jgi:hypothetical protein